MNALALLLHALAATLWVGGMFFAYLVLRPSIALLEPHRRLSVWSAVFQRFFPWVWAAVITLPVTGYWMVVQVFGGFSAAPVYIHVMHLLGLVMIAVFLFLYFMRYQRFTRAVMAEDWAAAGSALNGIRQLVLFNLVLGLVIFIWVFVAR